MGDADVDEKWPHLRGEEFDSFYLFYLLILYIPLS